MNSHFTSDAYEALEHDTNDTKHGHRTKRHIGVPDHGGFQRIIASGGLAPSLEIIDSNVPGDSIDVVFTTYWQYPAKVRVILPEDRACIEHYRNMSKIGKLF